MHGIARLLAGLNLALALAGCMASVPVQPYTNEGPVWPASPEPPRLALVGEFSGPEELGIRQSVWSRMVGVLSGPSIRTMNQPMAVAATKGGQVVYVADPGAGVVHRYDLGRGRYHRLTTASDTVLPSLIGVAVADDGRVFVTDSALNRVFSAGPTDDRLVQLDLSPEPEQPTGVAVTSSGNLLVVSTASHSVRMYNASGMLLREYGGRGSDPGKLNYPTYVWFAPPSEILVTDTLNFRVQRFDADGSVLGIFGHAGNSSGSLPRPKGVASDSFGHIYVMDSMLHALQVFDREGRLLLAVGQQGREPGQFWLPAGIFVTTDNLVFVADSRNRRVQVFRYVGGGQ